MQIWSWRGKEEKVGQEHLSLTHKLMKVLQGCWESSSQCPPLEASCFSQDGTCPSAHLLVWRSLWESMALLPRWQWISDYSNEGSWLVTLYVTGGLRSTSPWPCQDMSSEVISCSFPNRRTMILMWVGFRHWRWNRSYQGESRVYTGKRRMDMEVWTSLRLSAT